MPQPLNKVTKRGVFVIGGEPFKQYPAYGPLFATVISTCAHLESWLGLCLARILGTSAEAGVQMYLALTSTAAQRDVLFAAANSQLEETDFELFRALSALAGKAIGRRNVIAHGVWGMSPDVLNALVLVPPRALLQWHGDAETGRKPRPAFDTSTALVYRESDFAEIVEYISEVRNLWQSFWMVLDPAPGKSELLRRQLCSQPLLQAELFRSPGGRKSSP